MANMEKTSKKTSGEKRTGEKPLWAKLRIEHGFADSKEKRRLEKLTVGKTGARLADCKSCNTSCELTPGICQTTCEKTDQGCLVECEQTKQDTRP